MGSPLLKFVLNFLLHQDASVHASTRLCSSPSPRQWFPHWQARVVGGNCVCSPTHLPLHGATKYTLRGSTVHGDLDILPDIWETLLQSDMNTTCDLEAEGGLSSPGDTVAHELLVLQTWLVLCLYCALCFCQPHSITTDQVSFQASPVQKASFGF